MSGAIIFQETFNVTPGEINSSIGSGSGFTGTWTAPAATSEITGTGLSYSVSGGGTIGGGSAKLELSASNTLNRDFTAFSGDEIYVRYLLNFSAGVVDASDFFVLSLRDTASTGSSFNRFGFRIATGATNSDYIADATSGGVSEVRPPSGAGTPKMILGETNLLVARFSKSVSGVTNPYDQVSLWINPAFGDSSSPLVTQSESSGFSSLSRLVLNGVNLDSGDILHIDEIVGATTWAEVVAVPEPSTYAMLLGGLGLLLGLRRLRPKA